MIQVFNECSLFFSGLIYVYLFRFHGCFCLSVTWKLTLYDMKGLLNCLDLRWTRNQLWPGRNLDRKYFWRLDGEKQFFFPTTKCYGHRTCWGFSQNFSQKPTNPCIFVIVILLQILQRNCQNYQVKIIQTPTCRWQYFFVLLLYYLSFNWCQINKNINGHINRRI